MLEPIAYTLAILLSCAITVIGVRFLVTPHAAATDYGVPAAAAGHVAYLTIKGVRDSSYGIAGVVLLVVASTHVVGWFLVVLTLAPLADTLIVLRHGGTKARAFGVHLATAAVMLIDAILFFAI